jgi:peptide/nickel transport system substrate-binding protein
MHNAKSNNLAEGELGLRTWVAGLVLAVGGKDGRKTMHSGSVGPSRRTFIIASAAGGVAAAWSWPAFSQTAQKELTVANGADITDFSPIRFGGANGAVINELYDPIVYMNADGSPRAAIAESWETAPDGLSVTLHLRDAAFHSGGKVTADAIKYTIGKYLDPALGGNLAQLGVVGVDVVDEKTAKINFKQKLPGIFGVLSATYVLDPDRFDQIAQKDAGSGPFEATAWQPGVAITMDRFAKHWANDKVSLDRIVIKVISDDSAAAASLQTGAVDLMLGAGSLALELLKDTPGIHIQWVTSAPRTHYLAINCSRSPLNNKLVREAISWAIDREKILQISYSQRGETTCQPWSSTHWAHDASVEKLCGFDKEKAKKLMEQSGQKPFNISVNASTDAYSPGSVATAQILQQDFKDIGITLDIHTFEPAQARKLINASDFDMVLHSYTEGGNDPQFIFPSALLGPSGRSKFTTPELEALVTEASNATALADRKAVYKKVSETIVDTAYIMPIVHEAKPVPMRDQISGFDVDHIGVSVLYTVIKSA